jgi:hypothetical protein
MNDGSGAVVLVQYTYSQSCVQHIQMVFKRGLTESLLKDSLKKLACYFFRQFMDVSYCYKSIVI